jgi:hypothetical protein
MFAKLGQDCWATARAAGIPVVWRRVPITTVTVMLVIGFWLYDYVSVSSASTASTLRPSIALVNVPPTAIQPLPESKPTASLKEIRRPRHAKTAPSAFQRKRVGHNEVDYIANDVTIRLFTPGPTPTPVVHLGPQRHIANDVTVHYLEPEPALAPKTRPGSAAAQSAERSALASK